VFLLKKEAKLGLSIGFVVIAPVIDYFLSLNIDNFFIDE